MQSVLFVGLLVVLVLAPLPLGSNREWSWSLLVGALAALGVAWALASLLRPGNVSLRLPVPLVLLFLVAPAWAAVQAWSGTPAAWHHPLWSVAAPLFAPGEVAPGAVSTAPDDTLTAMLRLLAYGLAFFLAFQLCADVKRARLLFRTLAVLGLVVSIYGLGMFWSGQDGFLFFWDFDHRPSVHGTFVNRNHFATWLGLALLCVVALFFEALAVPRRNPAYQLPVRQDLRLEAFMARSWAYLAALIIMTAALILTHSRGGFLATLAGGVALLLALNARQRIGTRRARAALATAVLVSFASFFITNEVLMERLDRSSAGMESRLQAFELATEGIEDNPRLGFGYGTFASSFRLYRDEALGGFYDKTHNTYLENVFELGWPAALCLFAAIAWLALICLQGLRRRRKDWVYPATGLAATLLVAVHALVDFSLQIPATAVTYAALMGAACAQSHSSRRAVD